MDRATARALCEAGYMSLKECIAMFPEKDDWADAKDSCAKLKEGYSKLDGPDRWLFWIHFAVALPAMALAVCLAFGWPGGLFLAGLVLWKASDK